VAIAATSKGGYSARIQPNPAHPLGFAVHDRPLLPHADDSIEAAFATEAPLSIADLRAARRRVYDAESFQHMRMEDYFMDVPVFDAFDAVAFIPETSRTELVRGTQT
jgi:erythromycin esterase